MVGINNNVVLVKACGKSVLSQSVNLIEIIESFYMK